jgi:hypothetical protein
MGASAPKQVSDLVERFERDRKVFLSPDYKEEQLRAEFLNPFFTALGWDMDNKQGLSGTFKPVIHEESIKVAGASLEQAIVDAAPETAIRVRFDGRLGRREFELSSTERRIWADGLYYRQHYEFR